VELRARDQGAYPQQAGASIQVIGDGRWAEVYREAIYRLDIKEVGVVIATDPKAHHRLARKFLLMGYPVLVEKPVCMTPTDAWDLVDLEGIAFAGHTRLYSPAWRKFRKHRGNVVARAGGTHRDPWWDWGPHLVAMCLDAGYDPRDCDLDCTKDEQPLRFCIGDEVFTDVPEERPLDVLLVEFAAAVRLGAPNNKGLRLGAQVVDYLWSRECR
jgi:hypothetical protein